MSSENSKYLKLGIRGTIDSEAIADFTNQPSNAVSTAASKNNIKGQALFLLIGECLARRTRIFMMPKVDYLLVEKQTNFLLLTSLDGFA